MLLLACLAGSALVNAPLSGYKDDLKIRLYGCLGGENGDKSQVSVQSETVTVNSGYPVFDQALVKDITELEKVFGVHVPVYFINSTTQNAFFTPQTFPDLIKQDGGDPDGKYTGTVFLYSALLSQEENETRHTGLTIPAIVGHEFGHALQKKNNFPYHGMWRELDADFMAGWYTAHRQRFEWSDPQAALRSFFEKGDFGFWDSSHHGTPAERARAFSDGYNFNLRENRPDAIAAYNAELRYLSTIPGIN